MEGVWTTTAGFKTAFQFASGIRVKIPTDCQAQTNKCMAPSDSAFPMESLPLIMDM